MIFAESHDALINLCKSVIDKVRIEVWEIWQCV
jgi:hypothetical protein